MAKYFLAFTLTLMSIYAYFIQIYLLSIHLREAPMKKILAAAMLILLASSLLAQNMPWFEGSFKDAKKTAANENKHLLIDFYSDG